MEKLYKNLKYEVEWVDLSGSNDEEPEVTTEMLNWEQFNVLCEYEYIGLIHINKYKEILCKKSI